jgi:hypothetical protein
MSRSKKPTHSRPRAHRYALESRQMYDAAAATETRHHLDSGDAAHAGAEFHAVPTLIAPPAVAAHPATAGATGSAQAEAATPRRSNGSAGAQVYIVDQHVANWQSLVKQVPAGSQVIVLDENSSGLDQIAAALQGEHGIAALHVLSHGASDTITLGSDTLTAANIRNYAAQLGAIGASLRAQGDILLHGCDVSSHDNALIARLADLTHADVAASTDAPGAAALGGDWLIEASTGTIEAKARSFDYDELLDAPTVSTTVKSLTVAEPSTLNAPGASVATLSGWSITDVGGTGTVTVTASLTDPAKGSLSGSSFTGSLAGATAWLNGLTFTAADIELGNTAATTTLHVGIQDTGTGLTGSYDLGVTITPSNDPALVADGSASIPEGSTTTIGTSTLNPVAPEVAAGTQTSAQIVYSLTSMPAYGYLTLSGTRLGVGSIFTQQDVISGSL